MLDTQHPIVVTGATGYIATHVIELLLQRGYRVRGTVRDLASKKNDHLKKLAHSGMIHLVMIVM